MTTFLRPNGTRQASEGETGLTLVQHNDSLREPGGNMDSSSHSTDARTSTIGEVGTFRSAALARRWVSSSRRNTFRRDQGSNLSFGRNAFSEGTIAKELTPLVNPDSIPEDEPKEFSDDSQGNVMLALKGIILGKAVSVLLLLAPLAVMSHYLSWDARLIFWLNFLVMIPLAAILGEHSFVTCLEALKQMSTCLNLPNLIPYVSGDFTEEAALHTNDVIGGLLNASFGNAVEVVVAIQALLANEIRVVQASMLGSIFSNLLLVLGCCFFFGGLRFKEQSFNSASATANMALLSLSSIALVLPTPFAEYYNIQDEHVLTISRFAACFLLIMYVQLLIFQLYTHADIFEAAAAEQIASKKQAEGQEDEEEEEEEASIPMSVALIGLALTTLSVTVFSDFLVGSIDDFCESSGISRTFVGLILLPIVGNAVEHITAVTVAMKDKMDLAMGGKFGVCCSSESLHFGPLLKFPSVSSCRRFLYPDFPICCAAYCFSRMGR
jgi:Ca2+:H+ antiporter